MASSTGHWKLGLFVLLGLFVAFGAVVWLGAAEIDKDVARYVTYFDESVQGLDVGSPVKFRGVRIGNEPFGQRAEGRRPGVQVLQAERPLEISCLAPGQWIASFGFRA